MTIRIREVDAVLSSDAALSVSSDVDSIDADDGATDPLLDLAEQAAPAELFDVDDDDDDAEDFFEDEVFDDADAFVGDDVTDVVEGNLDETSDEDDHEWGKVRWPLKNRWQTMRPTTRAKMTRNLQMALEAPGLSLTIKMLIERNKKL